MQKFTQIHHVAIIVSDLAAAKHFYVDILGLPIIREHYRPEIIASWKFLRFQIHPNDLVSPKPRDYVIWLLKPTTSQLKLLT